MLSTSPFKTLRSSQLTAPDAVTLSKQPAAEVLFSYCDEVLFSYFSYFSYRAAAA